MLTVWVSLLLLIQNPAKVTIVNGYALADVWINGQGPFRMMVDTGASSCSLTPAAFRRARVAADHRVLLATMTDEQAVPAGAAQVRVGQEVSESVEVLALDLDRTPGSVDGVLGQNFLGRRPYLIDYRRRQIWMGDAATRRASDFPALEAEQSAGRMVIPVTFGTGEIRALTLDSGASDLVMRCSARCGATSDRIVTTLGSRAVQRGVVERIRVGPLSFSKSAVALVDGSPQTGDDGVLPANWFSAVYIDSAHNMVRLSK